MSYTIPPKIIRQLYYALFYSHLTYGITIWGGGYITYLNKISKINRAAINVFVHDLPIKLSHLLQYDDIYKYNCMGMFHKYANSSYFPYFYDKIHSLIPIHDHRTRFSLTNNYNMPLLSKTVSQNQFFFNAVKIWNSLPQNFKEIPSTYKFKLSLKSHIKSFS